LRLTLYIRAWEANIYCTPTIIISSQFNFFSIFQEINSKETEAMELKGTGISTITMDLK